MREVCQGCGSEVVYVELLTSVVRECGCASLDGTPMEPIVGELPSSEESELSDFMKAPVLTGGSVVVSAEELEALNSLNLGDEVIRAYLDTLGKIATVKRLVSEYRVKLHETKLINAIKVLLHPEECTCCIRCGGCYLSNECFCLGSRTSVAQPEPTPEDRELLEDLGKVNWVKGTPDNFTMSRLGDSGHLYVNVGWWNGLSSAERQKLAEHERKRQDWAILQNIDFGKRGKVKSDNSCLNCGASDVRNCTCEEQEPYDPEAG